MASLRVAGIDVGTTNLKVVVADLEPGAAPSVRLVSTRRAATPAVADELVVTALGLLGDLVRAAGPVAAVGIASMAETGVPLDLRGRPLTPLLAWDAVRPLSPRLSGLDPAVLFARTGVRLSPKVPLATWAWLADTRPEVLGATDHWAGAADLVARAMTGRLATDHTLAGRTGAHLLIEQTWDDDVLALVGLDRDVLPEVEPGVVGHTHAGVPVVVAGHDHQVGAHVCGVRAPGDTANSLGTSEVVLRVLAAEPDRAAVQAAGMSLVRTVGGQRHALLAGAGSAGATYAAWVEEHALDPDQPLLAVGPTGLLVLPYLRGRQCPEPDPAARLRTVGDLGAVGADVLMTALFEGLSLQTRWMYDAQRALDPGAGPGVPMTLFGGPGARNAAWARVKAAVLPDGVRVVAQEEPVAVGAAVVAAERAGLVEPGAVVLPAGMPSVPDQDRYAAVYEAFVHEARREERRT